MHPLGNQRGLSPTTYRLLTSQRPTSRGRGNASAAALDGPPGFELGINGKWT